MRFPQLCDALRDALGTAAVSSPDYPGLGDGDAKTSPGGIRRRMAGAPRRIVDDGLRRGR